MLAHIILFGWTAIVCEQEYGSEHLFAHLLISPQTFPEDWAWIGHGGWWSSLPLIVGWFWHKAWRDLNSGVEWGCRSAQNEPLGPKEHWAGVKREWERIEERSQMGFYGTIIINGKGQDLWGKMNVFGWGWVFYKDQGPSRCRWVQEGWEISQRYRFTQGHHGVTGCWQHWAVSPYRKMGQGTNNGDMNEGTLLRLVS